MPSVGESAEAPCEAGSLPPQPTRTTRASRGRMAPRLTPLGVERHALTGDRRVGHEAQVVILADELFARGWARRARVRLVFGPCAIAPGPDFEEVVVALRRERRDLEVQRVRFGRQVELLPDAGVVGVRVRDRKSVV